MTARQLNTLIACLVIGGALAGVALFAVLLWHGTSGEGLAGFSALVMMLLNATSNIVRNRYPGPEIDVMPPGYEHGCACKREGEQ